MAEKKSKEVTRVKPSRTPYTFEDIERFWIDEFLREPYPLLAPTRLQHLRFSGRKGIGPPMDIIEEEEQVVILVEAPGIEKEDIDITVLGDIITISGKKKHDESAESKNYYQLERSFGSFSRSFRLPFDLEADKAIARFENGILEVKIPKTEEGKRKRKKILIE